MTSVEPMVRREAAETVRGHGLPPIVVCPACHGALLGGDAEFRCTGCGTKYPQANGQPDLRLRSQIDRTVHYSPDATGASKLIDEIPLDNAGAGESVSDLHFTPDLAYGNRLTAPLVSHFPRASREGERMLDLGCGNRNFEEICRKVTGFDYLGVDYDGDKPDLLADAHALPFSDSAFAFVLSIAVLEHLAF